MNKKGFTLVEILSVIVILSLVITIVATKGFGAFNSAKTEIAELNNKAIEEGLELLKIDIENCNDELDEDLVIDLIGNIDRDGNSIPSECSDLNIVLEESNGVSINLAKLIETGYVEGAGVEDVEKSNQENYKEYSITIKKDENNKISYDINDSVEKIAYMQYDILKGNVSKEKIIKIEFVNYVDNNATYKWDISTGSGNEKVYAWLEEVGTDTYNLFVGSKGKIYAPKSCLLMFSEFVNVKYIFFNNFDTSNVTDMRGMFHRCDSLIELDLHNFKTSKVINMWDIFSGCQSLKKLNISSFDTSSVKYMTGMFYNCKNLTTLDLSHFNTSNVENMSWMFRECNGLTKINLNSFNTEKVNDMSYMFYNCNSLEELDLSTFKSNDSTNVSNMFNGTNNLIRVYFKEGMASKLESALPISVHKISK